MTESFLARLRRPKTAARPTVPEPPDGWYDSLDPTLLVRPWLASRQPGYRSTDILHHVDERGVLVGHLALDCETMAAVRLAPHGAPHSLVDLMHHPRDGELKSLLQTTVPLAVKLGEERRLFQHVKAGPVFGELAVGDRIYLLAAVSSLLVILEVQGEHNRIVWGGRAEKLPGVVIKPPSLDTARTGEPATTVADLERRLAEAEALLAAERRAREEDRRSTEAAGPSGQTPEQFETSLRYVLELQTQLSALAQERFEAESKRLLAEARLKQVVQDRDSLEAELAELRSGAATQLVDPAAAVAELERHLAEVQALLAAERRAREDDRRSDETRGQEAGQTNPYAENSLRHVDELQARLRAKTEEHLDAEDKRLIAEEQLRRVDQARDQLAVELDALRSSSPAGPAQTEYPTAESRALIDPEHQARRLAGEAARLAQELAVMQAQEQETRDALAATRQELAGVRQAQADETAKIRELLAAKRIPEAVLHSLARSLGENDVEAVLDHLPPAEPGATPPSEPSTDAEPVDGALPAVTTPPVAARPAHGRRNVVNVAPPADYPALQAAATVRKLGRNEACPCGSGKKYKKCCGMVTT
ncbi:MAG: SEC-C domain-containing protein [Myxococcales bacterium]|nr:SEC-C domain-containing protein [Myxococcales bacterium]